MKVQVEITRHAIERMVERGFWKYENYRELAEEVVESLQSGKAKERGDLVAVEEGDFIFLFKKRSRKLILKTVLTSLNVEFRGCVEYEVSRVKVYTTPLLNNIYKVKSKTVNYLFRG